MRRGLYRQSGRDRDRGTAVGLTAPTRVEVGRHGFLEDDQGPQLGDVPERCRCQAGGEVAERDQERPCVAVAGQVGQPVYTHVDAGEGDGPTKQLRPTQVAHGHTRTNRCNGVTLAARHGHVRRVEGDQLK